MMSVVGSRWTARSFRDHTIAVVVGLLLFMGLASGVILLLARHVDYDWDDQFLHMHDRWEAKGVEPGGEIDAADAPPPASDW